MLRIAVVQTPGVRLDQWRQTRELIGELVARAADENADVALLPECVWPAYFIGSVEEYFRAREAGLPGDGAFLEQLTRLARRHDIAICAGYVAERERRLSNTVALVSARGEILGTYRKCFMWDFDHAFFEPGREVNPINTPWGPVGLMICADARLPEIPATLATRGARLMLQPTAWVNVGTPGELWNPQPALLIPERAREFGLPIASASKWGVEGGTTFVGSSLICDASGNVLAQCGTSETKVIVADVSLETPRRPRMTPSQRARLLSTQPVVPATARVPPLRVALLKDRSLHDAALNALPGVDAPVGVTPTLILTNSPGTTVESGDHWLCLAGPTNKIHILDAVRLAAIRDGDARGFAPIRALALGGVHLVVVFGENVSADTLRSRATENRIFLVHATSAGISAYDPRGGVIQPAKPDNGVPLGTSPVIDMLTLDVAQSADKEFAPRTNPFTARRPECYEL